MSSFEVRVVSRAFTAVGVGLAAASTGQGLDFSRANLIYEESYVGETGFPTTPEVDLIGAGGLIPNQFGSTGPPAVGQGEAAVALVSPPGDQSGAAFLGGSVGTGNIGLRGQFNDFMPASPQGEVRAGVEAGYTGTSVSAFALIQSFGTESFNALGIFDGLAGTFVLLDAARVAAILDGTPFTVDLFIDRGAALASGSLDIPGFSTVSGSMPITTVQPEDLLSFGQIGGTLNFDTGAAATSGFHLDRLQAYSALGGPQEESAFFYQLDSARVVGNASGGAGCSSGFTSSLEGWTQNHGDPVAAGGFAVFQDPAAHDDLFSSVYDLALEQEVLAGPGACILSAGDGDATLTTEWVNHVPELPGDFYGLQLSYGLFFSPTLVEATTLVVRNVDAAVAAQLGVAPGLQLAQSRLLLDATDPDAPLLLGPIETQITPLAEAELAGASGGRIFLRLSYDESQGSVVGSYSLDGEASYVSPFTPLLSGLSASPFPGLFSAMAGAVQSTAPPPPVPSLSPMGTGFLLAALLMAGGRLRKRMG